MKNLLYIDVLLSSDYCFTVIHKFVFQEALSIHGVGERLADKVAEIVESGKLRKVSEVCEGEEAETLKLFMGVWGAGPSTAQSWYAQVSEDFKASLSYA